jgi:hypothetical protein
LKIVEKRSIQTLLDNEKEIHNIEVKDRGGTLLFTCSGADDSYIFRLPNKHDLNKSEKSTSGVDSRIYYAATASGIMDFQIALASAKRGDDLFEGNSRISSRDFKTWFYKVAKFRILIPDTNSLINRSLSSLCFILGDDYLKGISIRVPRLTILEMERMANEGDKGDKKEQKNERKRRIMSAAAELFFLKNNGARFLPELSLEVFEGFTRMAGSHMTDSWIRREVYQQSKKEIFGVEPSKQKIVTFVTSDLINALSAVAEEIDTLYFSRVSDNVLMDVNHKHTFEQIIQMIFLCSIVFEQLNVSIDSKDYVFKGIWEGKTTTEWLTDSVMISYR